MNESANPDLARLATAMRFGLAAMLVVLSFLNIWACLSIGKYSEIYSDFGGTLPNVTTWVVALRHLLVATSIIMPIVAIVMLLGRRLILSFYVCGGIILLTFLQLLFVAAGLLAPTMRMVQVVQ